MSRKEGTAGRRLGSKRRGWSSPILRRDSINTYSFRTNDSSLKIGDTVIVPFGEKNRETRGTVVSIGQYSRIGAPYPPEKTKFILRKQPEND